MKLLADILLTFSHRVMPTEIVVDKSKLSDDEFEDVFHFKDKKWEDYTTNELEIYSDAIYLISPKYFCYFLPGVLYSSVKENETNLIVIHTIISMLDRSPTPETWDNIFLERWTLLTNKEYLIVQEWMLWLSNSGSSPFIYDNSCLRVIESLELLMQGVIGISDEKRKSKSKI